MDKGWIAIVVALVGATVSFVTVQWQETTRLAMVERTAHQELQKSLVLSAIASDEQDEAAATLLFFVEIGLIEGVLADRVRTYMERQDVEPSFPRLRSVDLSHFDFGGIATISAAQSAAIREMFLEFTEERESSE